MIGKRFGKLVVLDRAENYLGKYSQWKCQCDCGNIVIKRGSKLVSGRTISCGCALIKHGVARKITHQEYNSWRSMWRRCTDESYKDFKYWGGRGITVCQEWEDINVFISDMGRKPSPSHSLDRIDNDKGYYKDNCRWATQSEQAKNIRR